MINNNSNMQRPGATDRTRSEEHFQVFLARVLTVDYERKVCTLLDERSGMTFKNVNVFPANASSFESTDIQMPEEGSTCLAVPIFFDAGYSQVAILTWVVQDTNRAQDAIAVRGMEHVEGWNERKRGTYRKAYPGQKTVSNASGYTERIDEGWDKSAKDLSRDKLDADRRQWTRITGRTVSYDDAGVTFSGAVNRPGASDIAPRTLPDGSTEAVVYLQPGAQLHDRYLSGMRDVIAFSEHTQRIQEFALDYPLPYEVLETDLLDTVLGTNADPWQRTQVTQTGDISHDDQTYLIDQKADHPTDRSLRAVGSTTAEGPTPRRRGFIIEKTEGTLVGYNRFDTANYGKVLKPTLFPHTRDGRFGAEIESGYLPVVDSADHVEARLAASCYSVRFPHEYNTTRWDVTKEGFVSFEIGSTLPQENILEHFAGNYEHPHGAGRSIEGHLVGSMKLVIGKNRDEEDALDIQALGQMVLRLGADDSSLPDDGRGVYTQERGQSDRVTPRDLQYWSEAKLTPGDAGDLEQKTGAENVSLRAAFDGGSVLRFGARNPSAKRRHLVNGYKDAVGLEAWAVGDPQRIDSKSAGRPSYGAGDSLYRFDHDGFTLADAGKPRLASFPYAASEAAPLDLDRHGLSLDFHAVRDVLLRLGANPDSGQSLLMDLGGGMVLAIGKDKQSRSVTASLDGGAEITIGSNAEGKALRLELDGDVDIYIKGNLHRYVTGDIIDECTTYRQIVKTDHVTTCQKKIDVALARHTTEAPDIVNSQGLTDAVDENS